MKGVLSAKDGKDDVGAVLKELNSTVPAMMRDITRLDQSRRRRIEEVERFHRHNQTIPAHVSRSRDAAESLYNDSLDTMLRYMEDKRREIERGMNSLSIKKKHEFEEKSRRLFDSIQNMVSEKNRSASQGEQDSWHGYVTYLLEKAHNTIEGLEAIRNNLPRGAAQQKMDEITAIASEIERDLGRNPWKIGSARRFVTLYLEELHGIMKEYVRLSNNADAVDYLQHVETVLDRVAQTFSVIRKKMLDRDLLHLDAEVTALDDALQEEMQ